MYLFDIAFDQNCKEHLAKVFNHPLSRTCKVIVSNSGPKVMEELGYKNIDMRKRMSIEMRGKVNESKPVFIYARKGLRKDRAKYVLELKKLNVDKVFKEAFELYSLDHEFKDLYTGFKLNTKLIHANLSIDPIGHLPKAASRQKQGCVKKKGC